MVLQALVTAVVLMFTVQMMLFVGSPAVSLKAAYADSWRRTGTVAARLFQFQSGSDQWIAVTAFGMIGIYVAFAAALDIAARFTY